MNGQGIVSAIEFLYGTPNIIQTIGNLRLSKNDQLGIPYYSLNLNGCNIANTTAEELIIDIIKNDNIIFPFTIAIDSRVLENDKVMETLKNKIVSKNNQINIRIMNDGYTLTREDYQKIDYFDRIIVDNCEEGLENPKIIKQKGVYKYDFQASSQPVVERRNEFDDLCHRCVFHINHKLTDEEFTYLFESINNTDSSNNPSLELNVFDPDYYETFLDKLVDNNINVSNICLLGYPLKDDSKVYEKLLQYPYEIDIIYNTCHDMVKSYEQEPYTENKLLYSQIEGGGKTSLSNYVNVVRSLEEFANKKDELSLSPLETAIYAKRYIESQYIYDPDYDDYDTDDWDNTNLSQILNGNGRNKAICLGFSTLYSALLRRCGIPAFRYTTSSHSRNIARIKDDKYNTDSIGVFDITWDLDGGYNFFGIAPREMLKYRPSECMTIADTLALPMEEYYGSVAQTNSLYEQFYNPIFSDPLGYTSRMLELMEYVPDENKAVDIYDYIYTLCENENLEGIDESKLLLAIENVKKKTNDNSIDIDYIKETIDRRKTVFNNSPELKANDTSAISVEDLNIDNVANKRKELWESDIQRPIYIKKDDTDSLDEYFEGTHIRKPRYRGIHETDEEYERFLEEYYSRYFTKEQIENSRKR